VEIGGSEEVARRAFEHAGAALESVVARNRDNPARDFHRVVAAAAYHIGRFSARAYSLLPVNVEQANLGKCERCLARLMLRDLDGLNDEVATWKLNESGSDDALIATIRRATVNQAGADNSEENFPDSGLIEVVDQALTDGFLERLS
jgi:hypothetical protein